MRADAKLLFDLESISHVSPSAQTLLDIIEDAFCPAVRVLLLAFERDHFQSSSRAGRSVLATMIITLPDSRCVEETHQHLRDLQRHSRSLVSAKITRARACVFSGVLEGRGINHERVTKSEFVIAFKQKVPRMAKRFLARSHKLSAKWADIMSKRDWQSQSPESFRGALAAWHWCREWNSMPAVGRPRLGAAWQTCLLPERELLLGPNDSPLFVLGCAKWGSNRAGLISSHPRRC